VIQVRIPDHTYFAPGAAKKKINAPRYPHSQENKFDDNKNG